MKRVRCKFRDIVLIPANAIEGGGAETRLLTLDGKECIAEYQCTWRNDNHQSEKSMDFECRRHFNKSFSQIRSMWIGRLGYVDDWWHLIRLRDE